MSEPLPPTRTPAFEARLRKRYAAERRFRLAGLAAILFSIAVLVFLLTTMLINGVGGFQRATLTIPVDFTVASLTVPQGVDEDGAARALEAQGLPEVVRFSADKALGEDGGAQLGADAWRLVAAELARNPALLSGVHTFALPASEDLASALAGDGQAALQPLARRLAAEGKLSPEFDPGFLTRSDATDPQQVGIWGALKGSMLTMLVTLGLAFPIGVLAALYLEEYAPKSRWTDLIEVSINNLAAVPSIVFGLLGLAVLLGFFGLPRGAPLVGGMVLSLMTLPTIIIATRAALKAVPPSIREAAYGVGASKQQVVMHHVLPLAMPGVMTGAIIGTARAMGESAAVLMIGMVAFIVDVPKSITDPATVLPVQIFLWADAPERAFVERTSAGIMVMLVFLVLMNAAAVVIRRRFERRW